MNEEVTVDLAKRFSDTKEVTRLIRQSVRAAILGHKAAGNSIAVWEDGKVVIIPPEEIEAPPFTEEDEE